MKGLVAAIVAVAAVGTASAADVEVATLKGVDALLVVVETIDEDAERDGLTRSAIQTDVESKLRQAGIRVVSREEWEAIPGSPSLYVGVNIFKNSSGLYAYNVDVALRQTTQLLRDPSIPAYSSTWRTAGFIGTVGPGKLQSVREDVRDMVDQFIKAWRSVNPQEE